MQTLRMDKRKTKVGMIRRSFRLSLTIGIFMMLLGISFFLYVSTLEKPPLHVQQTSVFLGADGSMIGETGSEQQRFWVDLEDMSPSIIDATLAIEDRRFFDHIGLDPIRIGGALLVNVKERAMVQGASTITQQYARNLFLTHDKTWARKIEEAIYALRLEMNYTKEDILEGYLNTIYYGHGAYGIEAASQLYFGTSASDLTLAQASLLAGIPKGPGYYSPLINEEAAIDRQQTILRVMETHGYISPQERMKAERETVTIVDAKERQDSRLAPYFQDHIKHILTNEYGIDPELVENGGLRIYTTLDPDMQQKAEKWVEREMPINNSLQTALIAMDPRTGEVKAMIGGKNFTESPFNRATQSRRSPGSTLKPFLYYAALERGFTPTTSFKSEPTTFTFNDGNDQYTPGNFGDHYAEDFITMAEAMAYSDNIYAVKTHLYLGPDALIETAQKAGIDSPMSPLPSLALGSTEIGVMELTNSYAPFANGGYRTEPIFIERVETPDGDVLVENELNPALEQVLDPNLAYIMTDLMKAIFDPTFVGYTSPTGRSIAHLVNRPLAGKSGSTRFDSWMVGFSPQLVTGVWVGYDDNQRLEHGTEGQMAKKIWIHFMNDALEDHLKMAFTKPNGIVEVDVDIDSGLLSADACGDSRTMYFLKGTEPTRSCLDEIEEEKNKGEQREEELPEQKKKFFDRFLEWFRSEQTNEVNKQT